MDVGLSTGLYSDSCDFEIKARLYSSPLIAFDIRRVLSFELSNWYSSLLSCVEKDPQVLARRLMN